jgi:hypothetical protein
VVLSKAVVDLDQVRNLVNLWDQSSPDTVVDRRVVFSVDSVAFRPKVTITSDREFGLDDLDNLESIGLFEQLLLHPQKFTAFLRDHWSKAYSSLIVFQIQPLRPSLPCCIIHAWPQPTGEANPDTVQRLLERRCILERQHSFNVIALAVDGDSAYSELHRRFPEQYMAQIPRLILISGIVINQRLSTLVQLFVTHSIC